MSAKSSSTISSRSSSGARGYGHRDDSSWKGTSGRGAGDAWGAGEAPIRGAGTAVAGVTTTALGGAGSEVAAEADDAAVRRKDGAE